MGRTVSSVRRRSGCGVNPTARSDSEACCSHSPRWSRHDGPRGGGLRHDVPHMVPASRPVVGPAWDPPSSPLVIKTRDTYESLLTLDVGVGVDPWSVSLGPGGQEQSCDDNEKLEQH